CVALICFDLLFFFFFFFSSRRRHTRFDCDWSSDVCSSDLRRGDRWVSSLSGVFWSSEVMIAPKPIGHLCVGIVVLRTSARASGRIAPFISAMRQKPFESPR